MRHWMLIISDENGKVSAVFSDSYDYIRDKMTETVCVNGYKCELFERVTFSEGTTVYCFIES